MMCKRIIDSMWYTCWTCTMALLIYLINTIDTLVKPCLSFFVSTITLSDHLKRHIFVYESVSVCISVYQCVSVCISVYECVWVKTIQAMVVITIIKISTPYISWCFYFQKLLLFSNKSNHVIESVTNKTD